MLTQITNMHHSKLPAIGDIGYVVLGHNSFGEPNYYHGKKEAWQVVAYPLNDNITPYSIGIHTAFFVRLSNHGNREPVRISGFYFEPQIRCETNCSACNYKKVCLKGKKRLKLT